MVNMVSANQHDKHLIVKTRDSLLTTSSGYTNYRGILNLVIILLLLSNARAALENIIKYGILVDPFSWLSFIGEATQHQPAVGILFALGANTLLAFGLEKLIAISWARQPNRTTGAHHLLLYCTLMVNLLACITLPPIVVYVSQTHPISASAALMLVSIVFLKLVSYHMMNYWSRNSQLPEKLHSRTTRAFLRSYIPARIEFEAPSGSGSASCDNAATSASASDIKATDLKPTAERQAESQVGSPSNVLRNRTAELANQANNDSQRVTSSSNPDTNNNPDTPNKQQQQQQQQQQHQPSSPSRMSPSRKEEVRRLALDILARYPANISLSNLCSFMMFPTLCYELEFARTQRVRKHFLIKRSVELIALSQLDMALIQQWIVPTVSNSILPFKQMQFSHMLERLLKLAIPNHVIWIIWFYLFFHSLLNIVAELTRFADREFYRDWWNSESVYYFWSNWNIPVHKWCARHLYIPLLAIGLTKCQASTAVFFVSAFFHEYLVSVPLKMFRMWAFTGMLMQLPWARFVSAYFNNNAANVAVWLSLIIGQPLCILMYYHDYYVIHHVSQPAADLSISTAQIS